MKIVILDGYTLNPGDLSWETLERLGELTIYDRTSPRQVIERIGEAQVVFTNKTPLTAQILTAAPNLRYIGVLATGYNIVDLAAAAARGIIVTNVPSYGTAAVAQHTVALLLELCNHVALHSHSVRTGEWGKRGDFCYWEAPLTELSGKTLGIIGLGDIGQMVAGTARALGMEVLAWGSRPTEQGRALARYVQWNELLECSDVLSLHCPLTDDNTGLIGREALDHMKPGALLLNTARGALLDERAVADALASGRLGGVAVDVVSTEPIASDNPLLGAPNCFITPHLAWAARESRTRLLERAVSNFAAWMQGTPIHVVSP